MVVWSSYCREKARLLRAAYTARSGSQSSTPSRNIRLFKGPLLAPIRYKTVNGSYHSTRRASEFTLDPEIIAITPISSASKKNQNILFFQGLVLKKNPVSKILFFLLSKILSSSSVMHSPSYTKIRCRAKPFLHRSFQSQRSSFFSLARHRNKIKLIVPRRHTVLRNSPTRPATPCARPKDLQTSNWKARTLS
ncbi:hypothetical protein AVEN_157839-1 [Araneus ventricosus]|uniref:Uncharacterized protein n=1 Tax=Araneus ventricosus TaxID=182803 RepID=A0A4Y2E8B8_ARAVE|nr:hypothetical protein AVEN_157839-1 [Araneus ventricosus]